MAIHVVYESALGQSAGFVLSYGAVPAPVAPLLGLALGALFAWAASDELAKGQKFGFESRSLVAAALFGLLVLAPIGAYFLTVHRDWAYAYLIDARRLPEILDPALVLLDAASVPIGFVLASSAARTHRFAAVAKILTVSLGAATVFVFATFQRLSVQATYAQFHGDFGTQPIGGSPLGYGLLTMTVLLVLATLWTLRSVTQMSR
jgi:hypothetical protein